MRQFLILIVILLVCNVVQANPTRTVYHLNEPGWLLNNQVLNEMSSVFAGQKIEAEIETDLPNVNFAALYLYGGANLFTVYINNQEIKNELKGEDFHAEITPFMESGTFILSLIAKESLTVDSIKTVLENAQVSLLNNVFICHVEMMEDPFFGGKMIEVVVKNRFDKDVDGKLVANILDLKNLTLIAENTNCAFARQGSEMVVDINFPEAETIKAGERYLLEMSIVDKENGEEVIDEIVVPVRF